MINANILKTNHNTRINRNRRTSLKLRNFDLPECIIFYGTNSIQSKNKVKDGVIRLLTEVQSDIGINTNCAIILLSETNSTLELKSILSSDVTSFLSSGLLTIRSSQELLGSDYDKNTTLGLGYSPSPSALLDSILSVEIQPYGFGGSSGFGTKFADPPRSPLPKHCVVFVDGNGENRDNSKDTQCRDRISAARQAGMRVIYIEGSDPSVTSPEIENLADAIVPTLGNDDDWDIITLDSISTPGSYWLNPPNSRDDHGDRIYVDDVIYVYEQQRLNKDFAVDNNDNVESVDVEEDEDYLNSILADIDPL